VIWRLSNLSVSGRAGGKAVADLTRASGTAKATWSIVGPEVTPTNTLARTVSAGCG
jgi:hypothetical protein